MIHLPEIRRPSVSGERSLKAIQFSPILSETARSEPKALLSRVGVTLQGLSEEEAGRRLAQHGRNVVTSGGEHHWISHLIRALRNPLVILLVVLAAIEFLSGDLRAASVMLLMVVLGVLLRFVQEHRASEASMRLQAMIRVQATVLRGGVEREIPQSELVPGDLIKLAAGDMIPADVRLISSRDLFVTQATLTGESLPVEKRWEPETREGILPMEYANTCFLGTSVESGAATAVVLATGQKTFFGGMAESLAQEEEESGFNAGVRSFTWLMIGLMGVMVPIVFLVNGVTKHDWREAFFFSMSIAVGMTPEMLPMIVSVCLSKGAVAMSKRRVVVKQLHAIQDLGAMDILCTDKTGTLTMDRVILERHCDVMQRENAEVLLDAFLIAHFQTGLRSVLDRAVLAHEEVSVSSAEGFRKLDELPFDFQRRMMSVVVGAPDGSMRLLTKGAPEAIFSRCSHFELDGQVFELGDQQAAELIAHYEDLNADGFRVLAVAYRSMSAIGALSTADESQLILKGYIAFLDPPKDSAAKAIEALHKNGITVKVLSGDNDLVTRKVCKEVGLPQEAVLLGRDVEGMSQDELEALVEGTQVFARLSPSHKKRVILALRKRGHVVGFLGDGINDAPALHAADVGISVDSAVDVAKAAASVILLDKDLRVLDEGVVEGRKVFLNILKYVRMGASSNFGNMFSVLGASVLLPYVPMAPIQVLTNNLLYDFSQVPIPTDSVEPEQTAKPRPWDMGDIRRFVLMVGPISSIFDFTTFWVMLTVFDCRDVQNASLFQTGWFIESIVTQTLIVHVIRTRKVPFLESRASWQLTWATICVLAVAVWLPFSPIAESLGFRPLPPLYWLFLVINSIAYIGLMQLVKRTLLAPNGTHAAL